MKVVLHDCASASVKGTVPRSNRSAFSNSRPSTDVVAGHATGVSGVSVPAASSAVAVIVFIAEPGGNWPVSALPASAGSFEETARISPVPGRTTTMCVGRVCPAAAASAAFWTAGTSVVFSGVPGWGSTAAISRPSSPMASSAATTETVKPGVPVSCSWKARCSPDRPSTSPSA
jgi:hypothetical protein